MIVTHHRRFLGTSRRVVGGRKVARPPAVEFELDDGEAWSVVVERPGAEVGCISGSLWVTFEGDPEDHVLGPGATFAAPSAGRLAMMAFRSARVWLGPAGGGEGPSQDPAALGWRARSSGRRSG